MRLPPGAAAGIDADQNEETSEHQPGTDRLVVEPCGERHGDERNQHVHVGRA